LKHFKSNLSKRIRVEEKNGKRYLVTNVVLISEGVLNGMLYPADEISTFPEAWNGRPLPLGHPKVNGQYVSANSRGIIDAYSVGQMFNCKFNESTATKPAQLVGEAWIDTEKLDQLAEQGNSKALKLLEKLDVDEPIEISTGLFTEDEATAGNFNGTPYSAIARNHRPDHLAILTDEVGACSVEDGCGMMVNKKKPEEKGLIGNMMSRLLKRTANNMADENPVVANALTNQDQRVALESALKQKITLAPSQWLWIRDIGEDDNGQRYVVYEREWREDGERKEADFRRNYTISVGDQIVLADDEQMVIRKTTYIAQSAQAPEPVSPRANADNNKQKESDQMNKDQMVSAIIANESSPFGADQKDVLMKLDEDKLKGLLPEDLKANCACQEGDEGKAPVVIETAKVVAPAQPATNEADETEKPLTMKDLQSFMVNTLPAIVNNAVKTASVADQRAGLVAQLKANNAVLVPDEQLDALDFEVLQGIAKSCGVVADYSGNGGPRGIEVNSTDEAHDVPDMPEIDWSKGQ